MADVHFLMCGTVFDTVFSGSRTILHTGSAYSQQKMYPPPKKEGYNMIKTVTQCEYMCALLEKPSNITILFELDFLSSHDKFSGNHRTYHRTPIISYAKEIEIEHVASKITSELSIPNYCRSELLKLYAGYLFI